MQNKNLQGIPPQMGLDTGISLEYGLCRLYLLHAHPLQTPREINPSSVLRSAIAITHQYLVWVHKRWRQKHIQYVREFRIV